MGMQTQEEFESGRISRIPLWLEWLVKTFGERAGYTCGYKRGLLRYRLRGKFYVVK